MYQEQMSSRRSSYQRSSHSYAQERLTAEQINQRRASLRLARKQLEDDSFEPPKYVGVENQTKTKFFTVTKRLYKPYDRLFNTLRCEKMANTSDAVFPKPIKDPYPPL